MLNTGRFPFAIYVLYIFTVGIICLGLTSAAPSFAEEEERQKLTGDLENELKQLPSDAPNPNRQLPQEYQEFTDSSLNKDFNVSAVSPGEKIKPISKEVSSEEDDDDDDEDENESEEDSDENDDDNEDNDEMPSMQNIAASHFEPRLPEIDDWEQVEAVEQDEIYDSTLNSPPYLEGDIIDEEIELEKRMTRATERFISSGRLDESNLEDLVEMLIRFAGDPQHWEKIRQILEKIRYEQITSRKAQGRLKALSLQNQQNHSKTDAVGGRHSHKGKLSKQHRRLLKQANSKVHLKSLSNKTKTPTFMKSKTSNKFGKLEDGDIGFASSIYNEDPYKYAVERPVAVLGERSKTKENPAAVGSVLRSLFSPNLKTILMQKSTGNPTDVMEDELKTLVEKERRLKEHFQRKQKLLEQIRANSKSKVGKEPKQN